MARKKTSAGAKPAAGVFDRFEADLRAAKDALERIESDSEAAKTALERIEEKLDRLLILSGSRPADLPPPPPAPDRNRNPEGGQP